MFKRIKIPANPAIIGYIAGIFDGEGNIACPKKNIYQINIGNTDKEMLEFIRLELESGTIQKMKKYSSRHKQAYRWRLSSRREILEFLFLIRPYLITKREISERVISKLIYILSDNDEAILKNLICFSNNKA